METTTAATLTMDTIEQQMLNAETTIAEMRAAQMVLILRPTADKPLG